MRIAQFVMSYKYRSFLFCRQLARKMLAAMSEKEFHRAAEAKRRNRTGGLIGDRSRFQTFQAKKLFSRCRECNQKVGHLNFAKYAERSEAKNNIALVSRQSITN
jgi:hypothetical protein